MANVYACLYDSWKPMIDNLTVKERGLLLGVIMSYHAEGIDASCELFGKNRVLNQTWLFIKLQMDSNTDNYSSKAEAGSKGGKAKASKTSSNKSSTSSTKKSATNENVAENALLDKENENENENETLPSAQCKGDTQPVTHNSQCITQPVTQGKDFISQHNGEYVAIVNAWNDASLSRCTKTTLFNAGTDLAKVREFFDAYGGNAQKDAINAIHNFAKMRGDSRYDLGLRNTYSFLGFLEKGVGAFVDSAKPFEMFAKQKPKYGSGISQSGCDAVTDDVPF